MDTDDQWSSGSGFELYVGRWSRLVATRFIDWLGSTPGGRWLDVGCGTGALTETILSSARPALVRGVDPSKDYVKFARDRIAGPTAEFEVADAHHLPGDDGSYDYTVSALVLNFVSNPSGGLTR